MEMMGLGPEADPDKAQVGGDKGKRPEGTRVGEGVGVEEEVVDNKNCGYGE